MNAATRTRLAALADRVQAVAETEYDPFASMGRAEIFEFCREFLRDNADVSPGQSELIDSVRRILANA